MPRLWQECLLKRRLIHHVFTLCAALSLLLCVAVCVLWVRSRSVRDGAETSRIRREPDGAASAVWFEGSSSGRLWLRMSFARLGRPGGGVNWDSYYERADARGGRWSLWFSHHRNVGQPDDVWGGTGNGTTGWGPLRWKSWMQVEPTVPFVQRNVTLGVSHALAAVLLAILPAWTASGRIARWRHRRSRLRIGLCHLQLRPPRQPRAVPGMWRGSLSTMIFGDTGAVRKMKSPTHGLRLAASIHYQDF